MTDFEDYPQVWLNGLMLKRVNKDPGPLEFTAVGLSVYCGHNKALDDCLIVASGPLNRYHVGGCKFHDEEKEMAENDAKVRAFLNVAMSVHESCAYCASEILRAFFKEWPEWEALINEVWMAHGYSDGEWKKL